VAEAKPVNFGHRPLVGIQNVVLQTNKLQVITPYYTLLHLKML
jgi:hypothetical protein